MPGAFLLCLVQHRRDQLYKEVIRRRALRDASNPMDMPESSFIALYRMNRSAFLMILNQIAPLMDNIQEKLQLAAALRFFAVGGFRGVIANDINICIGRSTMSKVLWNVANLLESIICPTWISLDMDDEEVNASKSHFFNEYGLPGVVGCVDGTHVRIRKPSLVESLYYNRKVFFSLNVMIVWDYKMRIRAVDGCRPGSCHDSFIWSLSDARTFFEQNDHNGWLLADTGYTLEPFVMTPYRNPQFNCIEHLFNKRHCSARNIVERTIGNLKSRFRCLQNAMLPYIPSKVVKIVNICCALHNICKNFCVEYDEPSSIIEDVDSEDEDTDDEYQFEEISVGNEAAAIRNSIANSLIQTL